MLGFVSDKLEWSTAQIWSSMSSPTLPLRYWLKLMINLNSYLAPVVYQQAIGLSRQLSLILGGATAITFLVGSIIPIWVRPGLNLCVLIWDGFGTFVDHWPLWAQTYLDDILRRSSLLFCHDCNSTFCRNNFDSLWRYSDDILVPDSAWCRILAYC